MMSVYPRVCGGTHSWMETSPMPRGLSSRLRGNRGRRRSGPRRSGSIPASAGEPARLCRSARRRRVYPRACGGTEQLGLVAGRPMGLSPRLRGNPYSSIEAEFDRRSIPAPAGEPTGLSQSSRWQGVYPRACGGTKCCNCGVQTCEGLSPRLRGNRHLPFRRVEQHRSIPAPAGEPPPRHRRSTAPAVYPRACGGTPTPQM